MVKLEWLKIHKFPNVAPGVELRFSPGFNVLLGQNGTGKTTLLNLLSQVWRLDFSALSEQEFSIEFEFSHPEGRLLVSLANERMERLHDRVRHADASRPTLMKGSQPYDAQCQMKFLSTGQLASVELVVKQSSVDIVYLSTGKRETFGLRFPLLRGNLLMDVAASLPAKADFRITHLTFALDVADNAVRFDESLDFFWALLKAELEITEIMDGDFSGSQNLVYRYIPEGIYDDIDNLEELAAGGSIQIQHTHPSVRFLSQINELLRFKSVTMKLDLKEADPKDNLRIYGDPTFFFARRDGSVIRHEQLSYGQKRLLAFYYYLALNKDVVIADELVNGLHHSWIEACFEDIGERQAFLTGQSPLTLDYLAFESAQQARETFIQCHSELRDGREVMVWSNMSEEDAETFFAAYEAGIQHVAEILKTRGLW